MRPSHWLRTIRLRNIFIRHPGIKFKIVRIFLFNLELSRGKTEFFKNEAKFYTLYDKSFSRMFRNFSGRVKFPDVLCLLQCAETINGTIIF